MPGVRVAGTAMVRLEVADLVVEVSVTLTGLRDAITPFAEIESFTMPAKLSMLLRLIVEFAFWPAIRMNELGFAEILKSGPATVTKTSV